MSKSITSTALPEAALTALGLPPFPNICIYLANGVMAAYNAYANNTTPALNGYTYVASIYANEALSGGQTLLGFAAYANDFSHNIVILRGTVTAEEAGYDLYGWGVNTPCKLPANKTGQSYGNVKKDLYDFYVNTDLGLVTSLAASFKTAVSRVAQVNPNKPWFVAAHSLGGALATLGALDATVSGSYTGSTVKPWLVTFGSLHLGDQAFATAFNQVLPIAYRFANLCDFVPSLVSLEPGTLPNPYVHVGLEATFVWQKWDDWANHSMEYTYLPTVLNYWPVIKFGPRKYPQ